MAKKLTESQMRALKIAEYHDGVHAGNCIGLPTETERFPSVRIPGSVITALVAAGLLVQRPRRKTDMDDVYVLTDAGREAVK